MNSSKEEVMTAIYVHGNACTCICITLLNIPQPPHPPTPLLLHLGVTAHTHSLTDYANMFGDLDKFYIDPQTQILPPKEGQVLCMKTDERDLILSVLGQMTRYIYACIIIIVTVPKQRLTVQANECICRLSIL